MSAISPSDFVALHHQNAILRSSQYGPKFVLFVKRKYNDRGMFSLCNVDTCVIEEYIRLLQVAVKFGGRLVYV